MSTQTGIPAGTVGDGVIVGIGGIVRVIGDVGGAIKFEGAIDKSRTSDSDGKRVVHYSCK